MKVCILSLSSYNVLAADTEVKHIGGGEVQIVAVARGLQGEGVSVCFVTHDHGQPDGAQAGGVQTYKAFAPHAGWPVVRFVHPRWTSVWNALSRADADVYLQAGADCWTGLTALWCRRHARPFVFVSMSEGDCRGDLPFLVTRRDRILFRCGLRCADAVVVQTDMQRKMMLENFGVEGTVIRPCCVAAGQAMASTSDGGPQREIVWIGRFSSEKRLEWFLDMAEALPDVTCHVVGQANLDLPYSRGLASRARNLRNVVLHGFVPHARMDDVYRRCGLVVSTSRIEGFPTVFMEAWVRGIPTVATADPDRVIERYRLGATAQDVAGLVRATRELLDDALQWRACSDNARQFFCEHHTIEAGAASFARLLEQVTTGCNDRALAVASRT